MVPAIELAGCPDKLEPTGKIPSRSYSGKRLSAEPSMIGTEPEKL
jgi:hypothetical protein